MFITFSKPLWHLEIKGQRLNRDTFKHFSSIFFLMHFTILILMHWQNNLIMCTSLNTILNLQFFDFFRKEAYVQTYDCILYNIVILLFLVIWQQHIFAVTSLLKFTSETRTFSKGSEFSKHSTYRCWGHLWGSAGAPVLGNVHLAQLAPLFSLVDFFHQSSFFSREQTRHQICL